METFQLPYGSFGPSGDNEVDLRSTKDDAVKYRGGKVGPGRGLMALSGNQIDDNGIEREITLQQMKRRYDDPNNMTGEHWFGLNDGSGSGDAAMVDVMILHHDDIYLAPAVLASLARQIGAILGGVPLPGPAPAPVPSQPAGGSSRFYSPSGKYCWNYQDDASEVLYDTHNSLDESTWTAKLAIRMDGRIEHF